jgi:3-hydroxybutyryl-CoA dehydratase
MSAQPHNPHTLLRFDDVEIGRVQTIEHTVTEAEVNAFGHLSGDLNPLHMEHGLLTAALVSAAHTELTGPGFAYVGQELRFLGPVYIGDTVTINVCVVEKKPAKRVLVMDTTVRNQHGRVVLSGLSALKELKFDDAIEVRTAAA